MIKHKIVFLIIVLITTTASAELLTVSQFKKSCLPTEMLNENLKMQKMTNEEMINSVNCYGYVKGVSDGLYVGMEAANGVKKFCLPANGLNDNAMYKMIRDFITSKNMPDDMPIRSVILATYANYFPCER